VNGNVIDGNRKITGLDEDKIIEDAIKVI